MAYLPGLTNDIFISYAHADNTEGWVDQFHERLFNRLRQLDRSAPFTIWRDRKLTRADVFTDEIYGQLASSGVLISILSPNGLDSSWCQQERERFERAARSTGGLRLGNKIRAIKVTKTPSAGDRHKDIFGTLGYEFYRRDAETHPLQRVSPHVPGIRRPHARNLARGLRTPATAPHARPQPHSESDGLCRDSVLRSQTFANASCGRARRLELPDISRSIISLGAFEKRDHG